MLRPLARFNLAVTGLLPRHPPCTHTLHRHVCCNAAALPVPATASQTHGDSFFSGALRRKQNILCWTPFCCFVTERWNVKRRLSCHFGSKGDFSLKGDVLRFTAPPQHAKYLRTLTHYAQSKPLRCCCCWVCVLLCACRTAGRPTPPSTRKIEPVKCKQTIRDKTTAQGTAPLPAG